MTLECHYCKKPRHMKKDCRKLRFKEQKCHYSTTDIILMAMEGTADWKVFVADSGCTSHMSPNYEWFENYSQLASPRPIRLGDDKLLHAVGVGTVTTNRGKLTNVLFVPKLCTNLFSISAATEKGVVFEFTSSKVVGRRPNNHRRVKNR